MLNRDGDLLEKPRDILRANKKKIFAEGKITLARELIGILQVRKIMCICCLSKSMTRKKETCR